MPSSARARLLAALSLACVTMAACGGVLKKEYEYEEELYLALDGSATLNVNASVAALVALRGFDWSVDPRTRLDREVVRRAFEGPGAAVSRVSLSRRDGRRFVHVGVDVQDVRTLPALAPFSWSSYRMERGETVRFRQSVGAAAGAPVRDVAWLGGEVVAFRLHLPSEIPFHNSPGTIQRGNILVWEQPLADRLKGVPVAIQVDLESSSILYSTLLLFGATIVAAAAVFALAVWWLLRRGRDADADVATPEP
jgi:hypothetical protein